MSHTPTEPGQRSDGDDLVEVQLNPAAVYRRKSSLVSSEKPPTPTLGGTHSAWHSQQHHRRRHAAPAATECIVHQFLKSQRRAQRLETQSEDDRHGQSAISEVYSQSDSEDEDPYARPTLLRHGENDHRKPAEAPPAAVTASPTGERTPRQLYSNDFHGQPDEQAWVGAMIRSRETTPNQSHRASPPEIDASSSIPPTPRDKTPAPSTNSVSRPTADAGSDADGSPDIDAVAAAAVPASLHSRHLTKRQLTDMVWGVRELSRRLGSVRIKTRVRSIFVLTKIHDITLLSHTRRLVHWLLHPDRGARYVVYIEPKLAAHRRFDAAALRTELAGLHAAAGDEQAAGEVACADPGEDADGRPRGRGRLRLWSARMCSERPETFDFCITLGGDGTVLYAGWLFQRVVPPVLTFSLGSLGFLAKFDFGGFQDTLAAAFEHGVVVSLRLRFECTVMRARARARIAAGADAGASVAQRDEQLERLQQRDLVEELVGEERDGEHTHRPDGTYEILNEVVVDRGPNPTMSYTEIFGDNEHFTSVLADGVCVSTPTGSTAYNLAAGGSLCHPDNPVMLVTSICAHALSFRPIILPDTIVLRVGVPYDARTSSWVSFDGRERLELLPGDYVTISASRYPFASVLAQGGGRSEDWVNSIRGKLGWNTRQKQKSFDNSWDKE
ncbi:hypothetical protein BROUX41_000809 [Berkeleyomyces rouxiae]|uniref:uncharacterized protein n=1 Tax=Berkeleyomyces rouxiae TaxID=2035830 RepID=UPI003B7B62D5